MNSKRLSINLIANIIQFIASLVISFFFTPYIVSSVGEEAYSFYVLSCQFISYIAVFTAALNSMASRYITIEWHSGNKQKASEYMSTVFYSNMVVSTLLAVLVVLFITFFIDRVINVPAELLTSVKQLFALVLGAGLIQTTLAVFDSATFCTNKLHLKSIVLIISSVMKIAILLALFSDGTVSIVYLGISYLACTVFENLTNVLFARKLMKGLQIRINLFHRHCAKELISTGIWNAVNQINTILLNSVDVLIANLIISVYLSGILGIAKTIPSMVTALTLTISNIFIPTITIAYAKKDENSLRDSFLSSFRTVNFVLSIITAGFIVFGRNFYALWMPTVDSTLLYRITILSMLALPITSSTQTIGNISLLTGKLKLPVLITIVRSFAGVAIIVLLVKNTRYGYYAVAGVQPILTIFFDLLFMVPYAARCIRYSSIFFYKAKIKNLIITAFLSAVFYGVKVVIPPVGWSSLILSIGCSCLLGFVINIMAYYRRLLHKYVAVLRKSI